MVVARDLVRIRAVLDPKVFKAYDVRGIYPDELDEEGAYAIGRAYVQQFEPRRIAVGRDMRLSSPQIAAAVNVGVVRCSQAIGTFRVVAHITRRSAVDFHLVVSPAAATNVKTPHRGINGSQRHVVKFLAELWCPSDIAGC